MKNLVESWRYFMKFPKINVSISWLFPLPLMHHIDVTFNGGKVNRKGDGETLNISMCGLFGLENKDLPSNT